MTANNASSKVTSTQSNGVIISGHDNICSLVQTRLSNRPPAYVVTRKRRKQGKISDSPDIEQQEAQSIENFVTGVLTDNITNQL